MGPSLPASITLGCQVNFPIANRITSGTVRFIGPTKFSSGLWCGIELKKPEGRNNGTVKSVKYFSCKFNYGIFIQADKVTVTEDDSNTASKFPSAKKKGRKSVSLHDIGKDLRARQLSSSFGDECALIGVQKNGEETDLNHTNHDLENIVGDSVDASDSIDLSEDQDSIMKTRVMKEIEINDSPLTIKIAESIDEYDANNNPSDDLKVTDHGLMFYVTGHQRPGLTSRHKSCPALFSDKDDDGIVDDLSVRSQSQKSSTSEFSVDHDDECADVKTKPLLTKKLSGIEKRIRNNSMRSPSPGTLRKCYSHGAIFPKDNYVSFDDSMDTPKYLYALKRSFSDVTLYRRVRSSSGRFPKTPPLLRKPWLRREKTAPEMLTDAKMNDAEMTDDDESDEEDDKDKRSEEVIDGKSDGEDSPVFAETIYSRDTFEQEGPTLSQELDPALDPDGHTSANEKQISAQDGHILAQEGNSPLQIEKIFAQEVQIVTQEEVPVEQEVPQLAQEVPRLVQEVPRLAHELPSLAQEVPRLAQEVPPLAHEVPPLAQELPSPSLAHEENSKNENELSASETEPVLQDKSPKVSKTPPPFKTGLPVLIRSPLLMNARKYSVPSRKKEPVPFSTPLEARKSYSQVDLSSLKDSKEPTVTPRPFRSKLVKRVSDMVANLEKTDPAKTESKNAEGGGASKSLTKVTNKSNKTPQNTALKAQGKLILFYLFSHLI